MYFQTIQLYATAQFPDKIIYEGLTYDLNVNPLESYFEIFPEKRPRGRITSTALWRGYVATFEIVNNELLLKDIEIEVRTEPFPSFRTEWKSVIDEFLSENSVLKIDWYIGFLIIPNGELINYVHLGYRSTYENYILIGIKKGDFINEYKMDYVEYMRFRESQFQLFKLTDEYNDIIEDALKRGHSVEYMDDFLRNYDNYYIMGIIEE
jgi:hypothetical protein